jgi:hypothetical protein
MMPVGPYDEEMHDGPEISERAREAAREFFAPQAKGPQDQRQESFETSECESTAHLDAGSQHADGRGNAVSDGVLISNAELHALLGKAWLSGYTSSGGQVRQNAGMPTHPSVSVSDLRIPRSWPTPPDPTWEPVMHTRGRYPCGAPAFFVTDRPRRDQVAKLELLRIWAAPPVPPGSAPQPAYWRVPLPSDEPICASCSRRVNAYTEDDVNWTAVMV